MFLITLDQSEASPGNPPPYGLYGWNVPRLAETEKHSSVCGTAQCAEDAAPRLGLPLPHLYSRF